MLLGTIFSTLLLPIQVHPMTLNNWEYPKASVVQATIDTARIIDLPRLKAIDGYLYKTIYVNEFQTGFLYKINPRKAFIKNYLSSPQSEKI